MENQPYVIEAVSSVWYFLEIENKNDNQNNVLLSIKYVNWLLKSIPKLRPKIQMAT